jgi:ribonucleotide reductase alpha subunit
MPTASTAQILGNTECSDPISSNMYTRKVLAGEYIITNKYLVEELIERGLWNDYIINELKRHKGSVQNIAEIPDDLKAIYKTAYELSMKTVIDMSADRGAYVCQSQSLNIYMAAPTVEKISSMHFYGWEKGLKTGMYYFRSRAAVEAVAFTVKNETIKADEPQNAYTTSAHTVTANQAVPQSVTDAPEWKPTVQVQEQPHVEPPAQGQMTIPNITIATPTTFEEVPFDGKACLLDDPDCEACGS